MASGGSAAAVVAGTPFPALAGLLDEYGTDPQTIVQKETPPPVVATMNKGDNAIDPTLRACKYRMERSVRFVV